MLHLVDFGSDHQNAIKSGMMYLEDKTFRVSFRYKNCLLISVFEKFIF